LEFTGCTAQRNKSDRLPAAKPFAGPAPVVDFVLPAEIHAGQPAVFRCASHAAAGKISERLWDFGHGIPEVTAEPKHTFDRPGSYRVTLIVWDGQDRGGRVEKAVRVLP
jgi:hypothetical protein